MYPHGGIVEIINLLYNMSMQNNAIEVRDQREQEWYWMNNEFVDHYGEILGTHAVAVYSVLCRHANNDTQKCFPSMETIGRKAGIKSRKTVSKAIEGLEKFNIIEVEKAQGADGKRLNNIYRLSKPSAWKKIMSVGFVVKEATAEDIEKMQKEGDEFFEVSVVKKEKTIIPSWMNREMWEEWEAYRIGIKKKLTPISIKQQIKFLEVHKADHAEIIRNSIMNGWTGLFPIKGERKSFVKKVEAPAGKYAHISK